MNKTPTSIRIPEGLLLYLKHKAVDHRRTFTDEIIARLEESRRMEEKDAQAA